MKALSLLQPYASLIAIGAKKIETRSWSTKYRGPLAIHASRSNKNKLLRFMEPFLKALRGIGILPLGAIVATCNLVDCIKMTPEFVDFVKSAEGYEIDFGVYEVGRYAWILEDVKPLEKPISASGALSLWEWEEKS